MGGHSHWEFGTRQKQDSRNPSTMDSGGRQERYKGMRNQVTRARALTNLVSGIRQKPYY